VLDLAQHLLEEVGRALLGVVAGHRSGDGQRLRPGVAHGDRCADPGHPDDVVLGVTEADGRRRIEAEQVEDERDG
jgi:hypothetical protein